jgi:protein-S-isoprenylcysteine O-methyltransferase Ste14
MPWALLWFRSLMFTLLVPCTVGWLVPRMYYRGSPLRGGLWQAGWLAVAAGSLVCLMCFAQFLAAGGTPAIFFTRPLWWLIGEEPRALVAAGPYRVSRNPMYIGVLMVVFGQAILFASQDVAVYGCALWLCFHVVVVGLEEPHLRRERGAAYDEYRRQVPRWFGRPR